MRWKTMKINKKLNKLIISLLSVSTLAAPFSAYAENEVIIDPAVEQSFSISTGGEISSLDSGRYAGDVPSSDAISQLFEGLYRIGDGNEVEFGQAESVEVSEDGLTYTFTLKDNIYWSNGDPVTAHDFEFSYKRLVDPNAGTQTLQAIEIFKNALAIKNGELDPEELGVTALDDSTLEIILEYPADYFPKLLSATRFLPISKNYYEEVQEQYGTSSEYIVNNGPFSIEGWNGVNLEWTYVSNDSYWDADNVYLDQVNVSVIKETGTGVDLFEAEQLDYVTLTSEFVAQFEGSEFLNSVPKATIGYLGFNTKRDATGNTALRRAISQAFDKELYAQSVIQDGSIPLNGQVPREFAFNEAGEDYRDVAGDLLVYDVDAAQKDWNTAKEELGFDTIELELLVSDVELSGRTAEFLQAQLQENLPGLSITIRSVPLKNRLEIQGDLQFDIYYGTWTPSFQDASIFVDQYTTSGGINFGEYSNESYDQLVASAKYDFANDLDGRWETLIEAEKLGIGQEAAAAPIYQSANTFLLAPEVKGLKVLPFGRSLDLREVYIANE